MNVLLVSQLLNDLNHSVQIILISFLGVHQEVR